jgi:hypothetical protein
MKKRVLVLAALPFIGLGAVLGWYLLTHRIGDYVVTVTGPGNQTVACFRMSDTILYTDPFVGSVSWQRGPQQLQFPKSTVHPHAVFGGNWSAALAQAGVEGALCSNGPYPDPAVSAERAAVAAAEEARRVQEIERMAPVMVDLGKQPAQLCDDHGNCCRRVPIHGGSGIAILKRRADGLYLNGHKLVLYRSARQKAGTEITGYELKDEMLGQKVINANVLDAVYEHPELVPDEWRTTSRSTPTIVFWGTIYADDGNTLFVREGWFGRCGSTVEKWCRSYMRLDNHYIGSAVVLKD